VIKRITDLIEVPSVNVVIGVTPKSMEEFFVVCESAPWAL